MKKLAGLVALAAACASAPACAFTWSDTSLGWSYGPDYHEPSLTDAQGNAKDVGKNTVTFTHADGYTYGTNFFNVDMLLSNSADPASNSNMGATEFYAIYRHNLSMNAVTHSQAFTWGPLKDLTLDTGFILGSKNNAFASSKRAIVIGPNFELDVPGDPSSAAFFVVGAVVIPGSEVVIEEVAINPTRLGFLNVLRRMGADIELRQRGERLGEPVGDLRVRSSPLEATTISGEEIPSVIDEIPALGVAAAFADGVTEVRDAAELRVKESDRIGTLVEELAQIGAGIEQRGDGLLIRGGTTHGGTFKSHGDHRIAMAGAIAASACVGASTVRGWGAVRSSYPGFADDLGALMSEP